jgi:hypothetical protein
VTSRPPRLLILTVLLLCHAAAIYVMGWRIHAPRVPQLDEIRALPIQLMPLPEREPEPGHAQPRKVRARPAPTAPPDSRASAPITMPVPEQVPEKAEAGPDWGNEAKEAAERWVRKHADEIKLPTRKAPIGIFDIESPHKAGDVDILGPGIERRWLSKSCYREFGHMPKPYTGREMNFPVPISCLGPSKPRGDLFEELKPEYLKQGPPVDSGTP